MTTNVIDIEQEASELLAQLEEEEICAEPRGYTWGLLVIPS